MGAELTRRMTDIGGRRIHVTIAGTGSPAVVIIPAIGGTALEWVYIQRAVARETTVLVYDRPGTGLSDPLPARVLTPEGMADDLAALLEAAGPEPPYILAGHSLGGLIARCYWAARPGRVCGMLLVDSSHEDQASRLPPGAAAQSCWYGEAVARESALLDWTWGEPPDLGSLPLTVLTSAERPWTGYPAWARMQEELAGLSSDSRHVTARTGGHQIHLDNPGLVTESVSELLRRGQS